MFLFLAFQPAPFYLHSGDRVAWYGDSITEDGRYGEDVEAYVRTRMPMLNVTFDNCGWGGDRVTGGGGGDAATRVKLDYEPLKPTVTTVMLGMNDGNYRPWEQQTDDAFASGYAKLLALLHAAAPASRLTLIETSPFDDFTRPSTTYDECLVRLSAHLPELGKPYDAEVVDFNAPLAAMLGAAAKDDSADAQKLIPDRVHPQGAGHLLMAATLLKAWNAPSLVADVTLDASTGTVTAENAQVIADGKLAWTETDQALPMWIDWSDASVKLVADHSDLVQTLDDETLTATNLEPGSYALAIDGQNVATFTDAQLAAGVNLARYSTPMMAQAGTVAGLVDEKVRLNKLWWRELQRPFAPTVDTRAAVRAIEGMESELVKQARTAATPKPHRFTLVKQ